MNKLKVILFLLVVSVSSIIVGIKVDVLGEEVEKGEVYRWVKVDQMSCVDMEEYLGVEVISIDRKVFGVGEGMGKRGIEIKFGGEVSEEKLVEIDGKMSGYIRVLGGR